MGPGGENRYVWRTYNSWDERSQIRRLRLEEPRREMLRSSSITNFGLNFGGGGGSTARHGARTVRETRVCTSTNSRDDCRMSGSAARAVLERLAGTVAAAAVLRTHCIHIYRMARRMAKYSHTHTRAGVGAPRACTRTRSHARDICVQSESRPRSFGGRGGENVSAWTVGVLYIHKST